ncbi:MAG: UDP-N-acetyl-D-glucosamine dehydrogenase, partial [Candidatus Omnitrophica bacterium CG12_big_fil_rev_8_21_14_0_65_50_5]
SGAKILVMGVTYKKDVKDLRRSPPLVLIELLEAKKAAVDYHDPVIPYLEIGKIRKKKSVPLTAKNVKAYDCVIITTDHTDVNYSLLLKNAKQIFDVKNVYKTNHANVVKL